MAPWMRGRCLVSTSGALRGRGALLPGGAPPASSVRGEGSGGGGVETPLREGLGLGRVRAREGAAEFLGAGHVLSVRERPLSHTEGKDDGICHHAFLKFQSQVCIKHPRSCGWGKCGFQPRPQGAQTGSGGEGGGGPSPLTPQFPSRHPTPA